MDVLITGITGFAGSWLDEHCLDQGCDIYGTRRPRSRTENIEHLGDQITLYDGDIRDAGSMQRIIRQVRPDRIFHLAAQSFIPTSFKAQVETFVTNVVGQANVLEAVRHLKDEDGTYNPRILVVGSSEEYGEVSGDDLPIQEDVPLNPLSPYATSKVHQDRMGFQYHKSWGLHTVISRAFNHTGPRRGEVFVCSDFAKQIAEIEAGQREPVMSVGNLEAVRDFTDVRDTVKAYWLALERGAPGEVYNVCSGTGHKIEDVLERLIYISSVDVIEIKEDPDKMRPSDLPLLEGDCTKFRDQTGWEPKIGFDTTLQDLLDYWRKRV